MKKLIVLILILAFVGLGCAAPSTITFDSNRKVVAATNYIISDPTGVYTPNIPDNWFTSAMKQMLDSIGPYLKYFSQLLK